LPLNTTGRWKRRRSLTTRTGSLYLYDFAAAFPALWDRGNDDPGRRFLIEKSTSFSRTRLEFADGIGQIILSSLRLMGVEAAEEMRRNE
jgi:arginyl-tRNA synthetase